MVATLEGWYVGLEKIEFPMEELPADPAELIKDGEVSTPAKVWGLLNNDERFVNKHHLVIYPGLLKRHVVWVQTAIKLGTGPLGLLERHPNLALPLGLTGVSYIKSTLEDAKDEINGFGLGRDPKQNVLGGFPYPSVIGLFYAERERLWKKYGLQDFYAMFRFIAKSSQYLKGWPEDLSRPFNENWDLTLEAMKKVYSQQREIEPRAKRG